MSAEIHETRLKATNRNDVCPCGSGKKYKKCHLREDEDAQRAEQARLAAIAAAEQAAAEAKAKDDAEAAPGDKKKEAVAAKAGRTKGGHDEPGGGKERSKNARPKNLPRRRAV